MAEEEVADFLAQFTGRTFADPQRTHERLKAERRAGRTPEQRRKKSKPKRQLNTRATEATHELIAKLMERLQLTQTDVIELAVAEFAKAKGVE